MSHEKTVDAEWEGLDRRLEGRSDPWEEMNDRERAEKIEELRERTPVKDLRVKALEDKDMIEFSDLSEEELNPESYSDLKEYALGLLDPEVRGAERKFQEEREEVSELRSFHEGRADLYGSARKLSRKARMPSALTGIPGTFASVGLYASGEPLLAAAAATPIATFFASFPSEAIFERKEDGHVHHGEYVRTKKFREEAYPLFNAADAVVAARNGDRKLFQGEALESYNILNEDAELVHAAEIEDYHPGNDPYAVDLRVDAHPVAGEKTVDEPAEEVQYVLVGGEELREAYTDISRD